MRRLQDELIERFGMDGNGKMDMDIDVKAFEDWSGAKLDRRSSNEFGTEDCHVVLIDRGSDFDLTLEIKDDKITHSMY